MRTLPVFASIVMISAVARAQSTAVPPQNEILGPLGFTTRQTARLNVMGPGVPAPFALAARCPATLSFVDANGRMLKSESVLVDPNQSLSFDLNADTDLAPSSRSDDNTGRPADSVTQRYCRVIPTLEIFDTTTGKTTVAVAAFHFQILPAPTPPPPENQQ